MNRLPASQGFQWLSQMLVFLRGDARRFVGLSLVYVGILVALIVPLEIPIFLSAKSGDMSGAIKPMLVMQVVISFLMPILAGGWLHAFRENAAGRPVLAGHLFHAFRVPGLTVRLAALGGVSIASLVANVLLVRALLGVSYLEMLSGGGHGLASQGLASIVGFYAISLVLGLVAYGLLLFSIPRVTLDGLAPMAAVTESLAACLRNLLPLLGFVVGIVIVLVVTWMVVALIAVMIAAVIAFLGKLGAVLGVVLLLAFALALMIGMVFLMPVAYYPQYLMWQDVFGDCPPPAPANDELQA